MDPFGTDEPDHDPGLLGVAGIAFAVALWGTLGSGLAGELLEWRMFMLLGTVFPALLVGLALAGRWPHLAKPLVWINACFVALGTGAALGFVVRAWDPVACGVALVATLLAVVLALRARGHSLLGEVAWSARGIVGFSASFLALLAAIHALQRLPYWLWPPRTTRIWDVTQPPTPATVFSKSGLLGLGPERVLWMLVLVVGVGLVLNRPARSPLGPRATRAAWAVAVVVLAAAALRMPDLDRWRPWVHWGALVGPADLVRDGGILLWNAPSQYGFLNTLIVAYLPTQTTWESLRLVNAAALAFSALFVFGVLFSLRRSLAGFALALAVAFFAVFVVAGEGETLDGPFTYPSLGAYRFAGVYLMLGIALWESRLAGLTDPTPRERWAPLLAGSAAWLLAVLWSIESGIYATATWLPALVWSRFLLARRDEPLFAAAVRGLGALLLPFGLLAGAVLAIWACYRIAFGLDPDVFAFGEYALSFQGAFFSLPFQPLESGAALVVGFLMLSLGLARSFGRADAGPMQVMALAAWGGAWSTLSYFVPRSHPAVGTGLMPLFLASFVALWLVWERHDGSWRAPVLRWVGAVWMAVILFAGTYDPARLRLVVPGLLRDPVGNLQDELPRVDDHLAALFYEADVRPGDRIVLVDPRPFPSLVPVLHDGQRVDRLSPHRPWLPVAPGTLGAPLPRERREEYIDRYLLRDDIRGGWLVQRRILPFQHEDYLEELHAMIEARYQATRRYENAYWVLEWRERRD